MPEFSSYKVQVRTALEHVWAEIEHDRGYKLGGKLPSHLNRRFKLLSGLLESADLEFNRLTVEIEEYAENIKNDKLNYELTNIYLITFLFDKHSSYVKEQFLVEDSRNIDKAITELNQFGIILKQLDELILQYTNKYNFEKSSTVIGFMRLLMMFIDLEGYFDKVYKQSNNENWTNIWVKHVVILEQNILVKK